MNNNCECVDGYCICSDNKFDNSFEKTYTEKEIKVLVGTAFYRGFDAAFKLCVKSIDASVIEEMLNNHGNIDWETVLTTEKFKQLIK